MYFKRTEYSISACRQNHPRVLATVLCVALQSVSCWAGVDGDRELLRGTAMMIRENREKIRYWQGSAAIDVNRKDHQGVFLRQEKRRANFWLSRDLDAVRWTTFIEDLKVPNAQGQLASAAGFLRRTDEMKKGQAFYRYQDYFVTKEGENKKGLNIYPLDKADKGAYSTTFDPMWYFTLKGLDMADRLMFFYNETDNPELMPTKVWRQGQLVIVEIDSERVLSRHVFDLSKGGNLVEYTGKEEGVDSERRTWTYESTGGAWVPKEFTFVHNRSQTLGGEWSERDFRVTFAQSVVNEPIDPCEFTLESLGVKPGDPVSDTMLRIGYHYKGNPSDKWELPSDIAFTDAAVAEQPLQRGLPGPNRESGAVAARDGGISTTTGPLAMEGDASTSAGGRFSRIALLSAIALAILIAAGVIARHHPGRQK